MHPNTFIATSIVTTCFVTACAAPAAAQTAPAAPAAASTAAADDAVRSLVERLDLERYKATVKGLTRFGDRASRSARACCAISGGLPG